MQHHIQNLVFPPFEPFIVTPNNPDCLLINPKDLIVEILGDQDMLFDAGNSQNQPNIEGSHALIFRCRRGGEAEPRIASVVSFDVTHEKGVKIVQLQGTKDRHVGYRFNSSFKLMAYVLSIMEETFLKSGIPVSVEQFPTGIEGASYATKSLHQYEVLRTALLGRMVKYNLDKYAH